MIIHKSRKVLILLQIKLDKNFGFWWKIFYNKIVSFLKKVTLCSHLSYHFFVLKPLGLIKKPIILSLWPSANDIKQNINTIFVFPVSTYVQFFSQEKKSTIFNKNKIGKEFWTKYCCFLMIKLKKGPLKNSSPSPSKRPLQI